MSGSQITLFKNFQPDQLQSYIDKIQEIKNIDASTLTPQEQEQFNTHQIQSYANALEDADAKQTALLLSTQGVSASQIQQTLAARGLSTAEQYQAMVEAGLLSTKQTLSNVQVQSALQSILGSEAKAAETMASLGLSAAIEGEEAQTVELTAKKLSLAVASHSLTQAQAEQLAMTLGVSIAQKQQAASAMSNLTTKIKAMTTATLKQTAAMISMLASNPASWAVLAAGAVGIAVTAWNKWGDTLANSKKKLAEAEDAFNNAQQALDDYNDTLKTNNERIAELQDKASDGTITLVEESELERLQKENELLRQNIELQKEQTEQESANLSKQNRKTFQKEFGGISFDNNVIKEQAQELVKNDYDGTAVGSFLGHSDGSLHDLLVAYEANKINIQKAITEGDTETASVIEKSNAEILEIINATAGEDFDSTISTLNGYKENLLKLMNADGTFDNQEDQEFWNNIDNWQKRLYEFNNKTGDWNTLKIESVLKNPDFNSALNEIQSKLDSGSLTMEDIKGFTDLNDALDDSNLILKENEAAAEIFLKYLNKLKKDGKAVGEAFSLSDIVHKNNEAVQSLSDNASMLSAINREISESGIISAASIAKVLDAYAEKYPEITNALYKYQRGILSEQELFAQLEQCYEDDTDQYIKNLISKSAEDDSFWNAVYTGNVQLQNTIAAIYGDDFKGFQNLAQAKKQINDDLIHKLIGDWAEYNNIIYKNADGLWEIYDRDTLEQEALQAYNGDESGSYAASEYATTIERLYGSDQKMKDRMEQLKAWLNETNTAQNAINNAAYETIRSSYDFSWKNADGDSESASSASATAQSYDLIERAVESLKKKISSLKNITDDTFSTWSERNAALADEINAVTEKIHLQEQAYDKYMALADSAGLDDYYKDLIINGDIDIISIADEHLLEQIDTFQSYYDKATACDEAIQGLQGDLNELSKTKFNNISAQFEEIIDSVSHAVSMLDSYIDLADTQNYFASEEIYRKLVDYQQQNTSALYAERNRLNQQFSAAAADGTLKEGSEEFSTMKNEINHVNEAIIDSVISTREWMNALQNLSFEKFDWIQTGISELTAEADFYIDLIEGMDKDLYDDNGKFTSEGITAAGLHAQNLNTYLRQANDYAHKIKEIDALIANDPANKSLMEQKEEYIKAQREMIISVQEERKSILDLVKNGYDKQIESLGTLIDKYKDLLSVNKEAHDYETGMAEKAAALASLQKQYKAWQGDDSETGLRTRQELENQIKDARDDIAESQYDKMISDTEKLLDNLQDEYENMINEHVDRICGELDQITAEINSSSETISAVLNQLSTDTRLPLTEAMMNIWNNGKPVADINSTVENIGNAISGTNGAVDGIKEKLQEILDTMHSEMNEEINPVDDGSYRPDAGSQSVSDNGYTPDEASYASGSEPSYAPSTDFSSAGGIDSNDDSWAIYRQYYPQTLNTETSVVDRLKYNDIDASFDARSQYWDTLIGDGTYYGDYDQNIRLLDWLKENGYARGTRSAAKGLHLFDEEGLGTEAIITRDGVLTQFRGGESVFSKEQVERLHALANDAINMSLIKSMPKMPDIINCGNRNIAPTIDIGDVHINVAANDPKEFSEQLKKELGSQLRNNIAHDKKTQNIMQEAILGQAFGNNSLNVMKYL